MTTAQADKLIKTGRPFQVANDFSGTSTYTLIRRERSTLYTACGAAFHRTDLEEVKGA